MTEVFQGGIPYEVDVTRLREAFPTESLTEGRVILHGELEAILNVRWGAHRYYSVINSWLLQLREEDVFMIWLVSTGLKVLNPAEVLSYAENRTRQKIRQTGRAIKIYGYVKRERLDILAQQRLDHQTRATLAMKSALQTARKELGALPVIESLPKPS